MSYYKTQTYVLADGATAAAAQTAVELDSGRAYDKLKVYTEWLDTPTGSVIVEASPDGGTTWFNLGTAVAASGTAVEDVEDIEGPVTDIRANVTAYTAGNVTVTAVLIRNP